MEEAHKREKSEHFEGLARDMDAKSRAIIGAYRRFDECAQRMAEAAEEIVEFERDRKNLNLVLREAKHADFVVSDPIRNAAIDASRPFENPLNGFRLEGYWNGHMRAPKKAKLTLILEDMGSLKEAV